MFLLLYRESSKDVVLIDPFVVPKSYEDRGLSSQAVRYEVRDAIEEIIQDNANQERNPKTSGLPFVAVEQTPLPEVEIPGTKLGLSTLVVFTQRLFDLQPTRISGEIREQELERRGIDKSKEVMFNVHLRVFQPRTTGYRTVELYANKGALVFRMAEETMRIIDPYVLARYYFRHGRLKEAADLCRSIIFSQGRDPRRVSAAYILWGNIFSGDDVQVAILKYKEAIEFNPESAVGYYNWALSLTRENKLDEAATNLGRAAKLARTGKGKALVLVTWGKLCEMQKNKNEAINKFRAAIASDPDSSDAYRHLASTLEESGKIDEAIAAYSKAIQLDPHFSTDYYSLGQLLEKKSRADEAEIQYVKGLELGDYILSAAAYGELLTKKQQFAAAEQFYNQWAAMDPKNATPYFGLAELFRAQKRTSEAEGMQSRAIRLQLDSFEVK
jgi:tetratricopeptide (TPR) repeat protein